MIAHINSIKTALTVLVQLLDCLYIDNQHLNVITTCGPFHHRHSSLDASGPCLDKTSLFPLLPVFI